MPKTLAAAALLAFAALPAQAQTLPPDGEYTCVMLSGSMLMTLGTLQISGGEYAGFSSDEWAPYEVAPDGAITWTESFAGMPEGFTVDGGGTYTDSNGRLVVRVDYTGPTGWKNSIDCAVE